MLRDTVFTMQVVAAPLNPSVLVVLSVPFKVMLPVPFTWLLFMLSVAEIPTTRIPAPFNTIFPPARFPPLIFIPAPLLMVIEFTVLVPELYTGKLGTPALITTSVELVGIPPHQLLAVFQSLLVTPIQLAPEIKINTILLVAGAHPPFPLAVKRNVAVPAIISAPLGV